MASSKVMVAAMMLGGYGVWWYYTKVQTMNDVRAYQDTPVMYQPVLSTARLDEFQTYDPVSHTRALQSMREFSRLYQESFLADADALDILARMHTMRSQTTRELHALRHWLPNDLALDRRLLACIEETDSAMVTALREVSDRRDVRGYDPVLGRARFQDDLGVRAIDDEWD